MLNSHWCKMCLAVVVMLALLFVVPTRAADEKVAVQVPIDKAMQQATWRITVAWDNGVNGSYDISFRDNGTFVAVGGSGRWFQIGARYVWAFQNVNGVPDWSVTYAGDVNSNGTTLTGIQGWSSTSGTPKGVHSGVRASKFTADADKLTETSAGVAVGGAKKSEK